MKYEAAERADERIGATTQIVNMLKNTQTKATPPIRSIGLVRHYVVLWDDEQGVYCPMGWDDDCEGGLCCIQKTIATFDSRKAARKAINISAKFAQLRLAQDLPVNLDFIGAARKNLRIVECVPNISSTK